MPSVIFKAPNSWHLFAVCNYLHLHWYIRDSRVQWFGWTECICRLRSHLNARARAPTKTLIRTNAIDVQNSESWSTLENSEREVDYDMSYYCCTYPSKPSNNTRIWFIEIHLIWARERKWSKSLDGTVGHMAVITAAQKMKIEKKIRVSKRLIYSLPAPNVPTTHTICHSKNNQP